MLSRVADSLVWLHRYVERAGSLARFIDVTLSLTLDATEERETAWATLVRATGDDSLFRARYGAPSQQNVLRFLTCDADYPHSIWSCVRAARDNARSVREVVSTELWEQVNRTYLWIGEVAQTASPLEMPHAFCAEIKRAVHLFSGIADHSVTHDEAWHFGRIGRGLERADKTSRVVGVRSHLHLDPTAEAEPTADLEAPWVTALRCASGLEAYRQTHGAVVPSRPRTSSCSSRASRTPYATTSRPLMRASSRPSASNPERHPQRQQGTCAISSLSSWRRIARLSTAPRWRAPWRRPSARSTPRALRSRSRSSLQASARLRTSPKLPPSRHARARRARHRTRPPSEGRERARRAAVTQGSGSSSTRTATVRLSGPPPL